MLHLDELLGQCEDLLLIVMAGDDDAGAIDRLRAACPGRLWLGASMLRRGDDRRRLARLMRLGAEMRVPLIATNDALYAKPAQRRSEEHTSELQSLMRL